MLQYYYVIEYDTYQIVSYDPIQNDIAHQMTHARKSETFSSILDLKPRFSIPACQAYTCTHHKMHHSWEFGEDRIRNIN